MKNISVKLSHLLAILFVFFLSAGLVSCSKNKTESKLQGRWILQKETAPEYVTDSDYVEIWELRGNNEIIIHKTSTNIYTPDSIDRNKGEYYMKTYKKFSIVGIENPRMPIYNSTWEIMSIEDNSLLIATQKEPGLFYREFVRE
jgi:hypothetical protein